MLVLQVSDERLFQAIHHIAGLLEAGNAEASMATYQALATGSSLAEVRACVVLTVYLCI